LPVFNQLLTKLLLVAFTMVGMVSETLTIENLPGPTEGQRILRLKGPIVLTTFFEFQRIVREDSSSTLILDFNEVPYMDSAGIGALTMGYVHRQKDKRGILLVGVSPRIRTALQVTKVDQFFQFADQIPGSQAASG
jgi:anti-anti-sigma factor